MPLPDRQKSVTMSMRLNALAFFICFPSYNWYSFTDPGGMEGWVDLGAK